MIAADEDMLICDFAETYGVFDWRALPIPMAATLAAGLRANSRIKLKMNAMNTEMETLLLSFVLDGINTIMWMLSEDGRNGRNRPESVARTFLGGNHNNVVASFSSPEDFESARSRILEGVTNGD